MIVCPPLLEGCMRNHFFVIVIMSLCLIGCSDSRLKQAGLEDLALLDPPGHVTLVRKIDDSTVKIVLKPSKYNSFSLELSRNAGGILFTNIKIRNQYACSDEGVGYVIVDKHKRCIDFVWLEVLFNADFIGGNLPDYIVVDESAGPVDEKVHEYRYGGFKFSRLTGTYLIEDQPLPDWMYSGRYIIVPAP